MLIYMMHYAESRRGIDLPKDGTRATFQCCNRIIKPDRFDQSSGRTSSNGVEEGRTDLGKQFAASVD